MNARKLHILFLIMLLTVIFSSCSDTSTGLDNNQEANDLNTKNPSTPPATIQSTDKAITLPLETKSESDIDIKFIPLKISQFLTWPDVYEHQVVFANYNINIPEKREVHLLDINTEKEEIIYSPAVSDVMIEDTRIGSEWVFWVEGHWNTEELPEEWCIKAYSLKDKTTSIIRKSGEKGKPSLAPRIDNDDNKIVWLEGYFDENNNLKHEIYLYDAQKQQMSKLSDVNHVQNPFDIVRLRNNKICFPDKVNDKWEVVILDILTDEKQQIPFDHILSRHEKLSSDIVYPRMPCSDGKFLVWQEALGALYYMDIEEQNEQVIEGRAFLFDIQKENIIYTVSASERHIYKFDTNDATKTCLTESTDINQVNYHLVSSYNNITVAIFKAGKPPYVLAVIEEKSNDTDK